MLFFFFSFLKDFIYLFDRGGGAEGEGEANTWMSREPDVGLDPRTPGSHPELKADAQPLSHPGVLRVLITYQSLIVISLSLIHISEPTRLEC